MMLAGIARTRKRLAVTSLAAALVVSLLPVASVSAFVELTAATGGGAISADGTYSTLTGPILSEQNAGELGTGTIVLSVVQAPAHFAFNPGIGSVSLGGAGCAGMTVGLTTVTAASVSVPILTQSTGPCTLTWSGLQVRATAGNPLYAENLGATGVTGLPAPGANFGNLASVPGAAVLSFVASPDASQAAGVPFPTQPIVNNWDQWGNARAGETLTMSVTPGTGPGTLSCTGGPSRTANGAGQASWAGCVLTAAGTYKLRVQSSSGAFADSAQFTVAPGAAHHIGFSSYPAASTPTTLTPQPTVAIYDVYNNVTTFSTNAVSISINQNGGTFTCTGGLNGNAVNGLAPYSGCTQTTVGSGYSLTATVSGFTPVAGPLFTVANAPATSLFLCWGTPTCALPPPSGAAAGVPFPSQPSVFIDDASGNTVTSDSTTVVTLAIAGGTPTAGGPGALTCTGGTTKTVTNGVATFSGCAISAAGTGYKVTATSSPALTPATSAAFNVAAGAPTKLVFVAGPPASVSAGAAFPASLQVGIADAGGSVVTSGISATISLSIATNPGAGALSCTGGTSATTVNGVATFAGCSINNAGTGYTLTAAATSTTPSTGLTAATSAAFNVLGAVPAAVVSLVSDPANGVITWGSTVVFRMTIGGNGANRPVALQVSKTGTTWATIAGASLTTDGTGTATFSYRPSDNRYYRAVFAGAADLGASTSPTVRVVVRQTNSLTPSRGGALTSVSRGTTVTFRSTIRPNRPELPQARANFVVFQLVGGAWRKTIDTTVGVDRATGVATLAVTFSSTGRFYVRSQAVPTTFNANSGWSPAEQYLVR